MDHSHSISQKHSLKNFSCYLVCVYVTNILPTCWPCCENGGTILKHSLLRNFKFPVSVFCYTLITCGNVKGSFKTKLKLILLFHGIFSLMVQRFRKVCHAVIQSQDFPCYMGQVIRIVLTMNGLKTS